MKTLTLINTATITLLTILVILLFNKLTNLQNKVNEYRRDSVQYDDDIVGDVAYRPDAEV